MSNYIVATIKPWNIDAFHRHVKDMPGQWMLLTRQEELTIDIIESFKPRYIFFPHWSWIVSEKILTAVECVCFHMADVPYGRGGSPLQNLVVRGHKNTKLSALRMIEELDAGPVYIKKNLNLEGRAQDIYERMADMAFEIMKEIVATEPEPVPQEGVPVIFKRRTERMSIIPESGTLEDIYNHIRMLDAETYPRACIQYGQYKITFESPRLADNQVEANVIITLNENTN